MADPVPPRASARWLWPAVIAVLAILLLVWAFSPSGDRDTAVEDPIVIEDVADPAAEEGAGPLGEGLPGEDAPDPGTPGEVEAAQEAVPPEASADRQPAEAVPVP